MQSLPNATRQHPNRSLPQRTCKPSFHQLRPRGLRSCPPSAFGNTHQPSTSDGQQSAARLTQPRPYRDNGAVMEGGASGSTSRAAPAQPQQMPWERADDAETGSLSRQGQAIWPRGNLTAVVLGGGETDSRRLFPLTKVRTLPAVPFGGAYRIIDLLMSNLLNSGVNKIHILTAYNSYSLNRYLQRTYDMSGGVPYGGDGYIEVVANSMSPDSQKWFTGTADVVRQFMTYFDSNTKNRFIEDILILPGDHVYAADLTPIISYHRSSGADLTVVCRPVSGEQAKKLGVVKMDSSLRISAFTEKPEGDQLLQMAMSDDEMRPFLEAHQEEAAAAAAAAQEGGSRDEAVERALRAAQEVARVGGGSGDRMMLDTLASADESPEGGAYVGSTGIYIFRRSVLSEVLNRHFKSHDFGRQIIPDIIREGFKVHAYRLPGYWADVGGSVADFYAANLALLGEKPSISFGAPASSPFFSHPLMIPATQMYGTRLSRCLVSAGCIIRDSVISNSVVGPRAIIGPNVTVSDSLINGASYYDHEKPLERPISAAYPPLGIGEGSEVRKAIVDLDCRVGKNVKLVNKEGVYESYDRAVQGMYIRDGIIVLSRSAVIPDGTVL
ncbi:hypothetical protein Agub_g10757 [Astrephomene gubernaculifera]|uniref:glucose-1-phosphate adenylyltransferase n=1 Tax=Astrephomene gubernaculifera TaxID=47775 RepID=A0AAD3DVK4_9CHLO|nr:hypothetical protein Agub_g10757 [Astrephomene gubernaculifera]